MVKGYVSGGHGKEFEWLKKCEGLDSIWEGKR